MFYIYVLTFWLSIIGYCLFIKYKLNIKSELLLSLIFSGITLIMFFAGLLNILKVVALIILISGIVLFIITFINNKNNIIKSLKKPNFNIIIIAIFILYVTIVYSSFNLLHYDNFSHWGTIAKNMILNNSLPNFQSTAIEFKAYQPGTATFIYYFCNNLNFKEGYMILAQNYLFIGFISSLLVLAKGKFKNIFRILVFICIIFFSICNILPYDLLVDSILMVVLISVFAFFFTYYKDLKKLFYYVLPISLFLCLIKNSGILLVFVVCCLYFLLSIRNKQTKKGFIYTVIIGLSSLLVLYIWSSHVEFAYGVSGLESHHALTSNNIVSHVKSLGIDKIVSFIKIYIKRFFDLKNNVSSVVMILINIFLLSFLFNFKEKKRKREIIVSLVVVDLIFLFYYVMLGIMYILSMEEAALFEIACFDRYMFTIVFALFGLLMLLFMKFYNKQEKSTIVYIYSILFICFMFSFVSLNGNSVFNIKDNYKLFFGKNSYNESYAKKFDMYLEDKYINMNEDDNLYWVYSPDKESNLYGYTYYMAKYKFNHGNIKVVDDINNIKELTEENIIVALEEDKSFKKFIYKNSICKISEGLYKKCNSN